MKNKLVLITGATSGIGEATARTLAGLGATIVFTARDKEKAENLLAALSRSQGQQHAYLLCDFSLLRSVKQMADEFCTRFPKLDVLINNAGVWTTEHQLSKDGIELTFAVNHLAPFLLTTTVLGKLNTGSRIVTLSSALHFQGELNFEDLEGKIKYSGYKAYCNSKLANAAFSRELSYRLPAGITANCLHPGVVRTNLFTTVNPLIKSTMGWLMLTPEKGARTSIYLASSPAVEGVTGEYFDSCKIKKAHAKVYDKTATAKLWEISETYIKNNS